MRTLKAWMALAFVGGFTTAGLCGEQSLVWPRFRGPNGSGIAEDQKPPVEIGPDKNVQWKTPVPRGLSSPIVAGDRLILTTFNDGKLFTIAYDQADGHEAWRKEAPAKQIEHHHKSEGSPAASTPVTNGRRIVSYFGSCGLFCYDLDGKEQWRLEMPMISMAGEFGSGVSPIIADDTVILVRDEMKNPEVLALDLATGAVKWRTPRLSRASYCTPVVWDTPSGKQLAAPGHAHMTGYDLKSGAEIWSVGGVPSACCASPVVADGNILFAGGAGGGPDDQAMPKFDAMLKDLDTDHDGVLSRAESEKAFEGFFDNLDTNKDGKITRDEWDALIKFMAEGKNSAFALTPGGKGDVTSSNVLWTKTKGLPYVTSALAYRGQYLMVKDGGIVTAYDPKTGRELYQERLAAQGTYYASPVAANGNIYFASADGIVTVLKGGADKPEVVAANPKLGEKIAATPAIAHDRLYIRTDKHLFAFGSR